MKNKKENEFLDMIGEVRKYLTPSKHGRDTTMAAAFIESSYSLHWDTLREFNDNKRADRVGTALGGQMLAVHTVNADIKAKVDEDLGYFLKQIIHSDTYRPVKKLQSADDLKTPIDRTRPYRSDSKLQEQRTVSGQRGANKKIPFSKSICFTFTSIPHNTTTYNYTFSVALMIDLRFCILKPYDIYASNEVTNSRWYIPGTNGWAKYVKNSFKVCEYKNLKTSCTTIRDLSSVQLADFEKKVMSSQNEIRPKVTVAALVGIQALAKEKIPNTSDYKYVETKVADRINALFANYYYRQMVHQHELYKGLLYLWQNFPTYVLNPKDGLKLYSIQEQINDLFESFNRGDHTVSKQRLNLFSSLITDQDIYSPSIKLFFDTHVNQSSQAKIDALDGKNIKRAVDEGYEVKYLTLEQKYNYLIEMDQQPISELSTEEATKILKDQEKNNKCDEKLLNLCLERDVQYVRETDFIEFLYKTDNFQIMDRYIKQNIWLESKTELNFGVLDYLIKQEYYTAIYKLIISYQVNLSDTQMTIAVQKALLNLALQKKNDQDIDTILELKNTDKSFSCNILKQLGDFKRIFCLIKRSNIEIPEMNPGMQAEILHIAFSSDDKPLFNKILESKNTFGDLSLQELILALVKRGNYKLINTLINSGTQLKYNNSEISVLDFLIQERQYAVINHLIKDFDIELTSQQMTSQIAAELLHNKPNYKSFDRVIDYPIISTGEFLYVLITKEYYHILNSLIERNITIDHNKILDFLIQEKQYSVIINLIGKFHLAFTGAPINNWEFFQNLLETAHKGKNYDFIQEILAQASDIRLSKMLNQMGKMFFNSRLDESKESALFIPTMAKISLEYILQIDGLSCKDIVLVLQKLMQVDYYSEPKKWANMQRLIDKSTNPLDVVIKVVKETKQSRYLPYLLNIISKYCNQHGQEHREAGRQVALSLMTTIINRCDSIASIISIVHRTEAPLPRASEAKHHPWEFLQKRRSTMRATTYTYSCLNKIDASQTWISIMARAQDRIMELAKSAQDLPIEDPAVSAFLGKQTRHSFFGSTMVEEYKKLCKTKVLSRPSVYNPLPF